LTAAFEAADRYRLSGYERRTRSPRRLTRATGLGVRQLRRRCIEETGLSPKHLARVGRFRDVCSRIATDESANWADLACESGYYDQAHLINEFREFSGLTPAAYRHEIHRRPFFPIHEARF